MNEYIDNKHNGWRITFVNPAKQSRVVWMAKGLHEAEAVRCASLKANNPQGYWRMVKAEYVA